MYIHGTSPEEQARLSRLNDLLNQSCLEAVEPDYQSRILDVGSGLGQFTRLLARSCGGTALGVERDPEQLATAKSLASEGDPVEFRQGDASNLPLSPDERGAFDLAHARFVLEHVADPQRLVHQMVQALRPGGRVFLLDDDHDLLRLDPEPKKFLAVWQAYVASYTALGCDPFVGRKLPQLLHKAGALPTRASAVFFGGCKGDDSFEALCDNMIGLIQSALGTMLPMNLCSATGLEEGLSEFGEWRKCNYANMVFMAPWAEGKRL